MAKYSMDNLKFRKLLPHEIEVRIGSTGKSYIDLLLYKKAQTDQQILTESVGNHWKNDMKVIKDVLWAGIGIKDPDSKSPEPDNYIWRWSAGTESNMEAQKGEDTDAFKRAGFRWGIGVELYTAPHIRLWDTNDPKKKTFNATKNSKGNVSTYDTFSVKTIEYDDFGRISKLLVYNDILKKAVCHFGFTSNEEVTESLDNSKARANQIIQALKNEES